MLNKELYNKPLKLDNNNNAQHKNITSSTSCIDPGPMVIPDEFDWNEKGKVTPIKQQFICGSCFIFSAVAVVESAYLIHGKTNLKPEEIDISEQAILDCMNPDVCRTGGWPTQAWMTMAHQGIVDEEDAPYMSMVSCCQLHYSIDHQSIYSFFFAFLKIVYWRLQSISKIKNQL